METKDLLQPAIVFDCFSEVNKVPRPSKKEEKMIAFLRKFGEELGLPTEVDETGNVIIRKPATKGYENRQTVILQSHMDMVCEKNKDVDFDFEHDAIQTWIDGEWMRAKGTTLGADDGIGVAMEMALLKSDDIEHGPIECVFTRDEETGLTGAEGMKPGFMTGDFLINLDSEDEGQMFVSCAGGARTTGTYPFPTEQLPEGYFTFQVGVRNLVGGHSGDDINKKRANAIKILDRFLYLEQDKMDVRLAQFNSGKLHNAIPRDGVIVFAVPAAEKETVRVDWNVFTANVEDEYHVTDTAMEFHLESTDAEPVIAKDASRRVILALQAADNGVFAMCQDEALADMVETSNNIASVASSENEINIITSQRSNVMSNLENESNTIKAVFELAGAEVKQSDGYPAWKMNPNSKLTKVAVESYKKLFGKEPIVRGIHAGLECGLFSERYPNLDMVSFGPTLRDVHTPEERLHIPTVQMVWDHLLDIMKHV